MTSGVVNTLKTKEGVSCDNSDVHLFSRTSSSTRVIKCKVKIKSGRNSTRRKRRGGGERKYYSPVR